VDLFWSQLFNGRLGQKGVLTDFEDCGERGTLLQSSEPDTRCHTRGDTKSRAHYGYDYDYNEFYDYYDYYNYYYDCTSNNTSEVGNNTSEEENNTSEEENNTSGVEQNCLWDCEWKFNPYFKSILSWEITRNNDDKNQDTDTVAIFITSPRIPKDLDCLKNCFQRKEYKFLKDCTDKISLRQNGESSYNTEDHNRVLACMVLNRKRERKENSTDTADKRNFLNIFPEKGKSKVFSEKCLLRPDYGSYIRAANPSDLALEFCLLARNDLANCNPDMQLYNNADCIFLAKLIDDSKRNVNDVKSFGSSTTSAETTYNPWLCSLKERGFRGRHRCGVTLLSGPPLQTILASAAHCNYVCKEKDSDQLILEICCCREDSDASCQESSYCPEKGKASLFKAKPSDMQIVCGEHNIDVKPEKYSTEEEIVLTITEIINHPNYEPDTIRDGVKLDSKGPYAGSDIAVYRVDDEPLKTKMARKVLWPACLPKEKYTTQRGIFAGWLDPEPYYRIDEDRDLKTYRNNYLFTKQLQVEEVLCRDPPWMKSNTYYPPGTTCYRDPSMTSCFLYGNSGSGVLRRFDETERYSWVGPLSMSKGCDLALITDNTITYAAENPGVFTNAICYLDWIANQYGLRMPANFKKPSTCSDSRGDIKDIDKKVCRASGEILTQNLPFASSVRFTYCDFTQKVWDNLTQKFTDWDECRLYAQEGFAYNLYQCKDRDNTTVICANNCKGVDPNAVVIGGTAFVAASSFTALSFLATTLPLWIGPAAVGGWVATGQCPPTECRTRRGRCCPFQINRGRLICPSRC